MRLENKKYYVSNNTANPIDLTIEEETIVCGVFKPVGTSQEIPPFLGRINRVPA